MGAVLLYISTIRHSRSSPSYTFNSHSAVSVHSERTIVKSSIFCAISTVLAAGLESSESKPAARTVEMAQKIDDFTIVLSEWTDTAECELKEMGRAHV